MRKAAAALTLFFIAMFGACGLWGAPKIKLGIDVLEDMNFAPLAGKRVGLLTHPAGVNGAGLSTIDVLRRARNVRLVALYGPEHGIYGNEKANVPVENVIDKRTGLPVFSLYGKYRKPSAEMLKNIDVLVIDLQDIGTRSYTYTSCMLRAMEACFELNKQVVVLDRPNPLGGVKVDGPMLEEQFKSYVGLFKVPYVHGLTIGELAKMAKATPGAMEITSKQQIAGRLLVIPMKGWTRAMTWEYTCLKWVPTSPAIPAYSAVLGYPMTGLGCQIGDFQHGYGTQYPFRLLTFKGRSADELVIALNQKKIPGLAFRKVQAKNSSGKAVEGAYVMVTNYEILKPTRLDFYLMQLACELSGVNPFARASEADASLFNKHVGSSSWWKEIKTRGKYANPAPFFVRWDAECAKFRESSKKFWLYQ